MKAKLLITFLCLWCALPHRQASAAEIHFLEAPCKVCGGNVAYADKDTDATCQSCGEKYALVLLMIAGVLAVCAGGCYTIKKLKKANGTNGMFNVTNRFRGELTQLLLDPQISGMSVIRSSDTNDVPWLLSLNTSTNATGRYVLEQSQDLQTWTELGQFADENFIAVNESPASGAFYRLRVNP